MSFDFPLPADSREFPSVRGQDWELSGEQSWQLSVVHRVGAAVQQYGEILANNTEALADIPVPARDGTEGSAVYAAFGDFSAVCRDRLRDLSERLVQAGENTQKGAIDVAETDHENARRMPPTDIDAAVVRSR